jgi:protein-arginine kinase activator protein McsA
MTYDDWKTETPEDEADRRRGRIVCECCDERRATGSYEFKGIWRGPAAYLCDDCAEARHDESLKPVCADCEDKIGAVFVEDLTGHLGHDEYLCEQCAAQRRRDEESINDPS